MGRKDQVVAIATAALYLSTSAIMVFVPGTHRRDETTGVAEIPAQSGVFLRGTAITDHVYRALDRGRLQGWLILARDSDDEWTALLKRDFQWNRLDLYAARD